MLFECDSRCFGPLHLSALTICCIVWKVLRPWASTLFEPNDDNIHRWNDYYFYADFTPVRSTKPASSLGPQSCFPVCSPITYSRIQHVHPTILSSIISPQLMAIPSKRVLKASSGYFPFFELPRELRDWIYAFALAYDKKIQIKTTVCPTQVSNICGNVGEC
jgi:hypothetical protein